MKKKFENVIEISDKDTYAQVKIYCEEVVQYATHNGYLSEPESDNEYTRELGRLFGLLADYESIYMEFKHLKVKNPLIISIEKEMARKALNQRQTAELLEIKENTFSQVMSGKRNVSMKLAKRLYNTLKIDPTTILKFS